MNFNKKGAFTLASLLLVLILAFTLTGCPMTKTQSKQPKATPQDRKVVMEKIDGVASEMTGVKNAYSVLLGNTALVGVELENPKISKAEMFKMEEAVGKRIIKEVNVVRTVYTTAAPDAVQRVKEMSQKVRKGQPVNKFEKDIKGITKGMNPTNR